MIGEVQQFPTYYFLALIIAVVNLCLSLSLALWHDGALFRAWFHSLMGWALFTMALISFWLQSL